MDGDIEKEIIERIQRIPDNTSPENWRAFATAYVLGYNIMVRDIVDALADVGTLTYEKAQTDKLFADIVKAVTTAIEANDKWLKKVRDEPN